MKLFFKESNVLLDILKTFSFYTNTIKLFNVSGNQDQLSCLHGIRFLSLGWVILGHSYSFVLGYVGKISSNLGLIETSDKVRVLNFV